MSMKAARVERDSADIEFALCVWEPAYLSCAFVQQEHLRRKTITTAGFDIHQDELLNFCFLCTCDWSFSQQSCSCRIGQVLRPASKMRRLLLAFEADSKYPCLRVARLLCLDCFAFGASQWQPDLEYLAALREAKCIWESKSGSKKWKEL